MSRSIKVRLSSADTPKNKSLSSNGEFILDDICMYMYSNEDLATSNYDLEGGFLVDKAGKYKYIKEEATLTVKESYGDEIFRICKVEKNSSEVRVYARQITIEDSLRCWLPDVRPTNLNGHATLEYMLNGTNEYKANKQYAKDLEVFSDIGKLNTAYYQDMNLYQALHDSDQSFKNRWGGEVQRRGYRININKRIGINRGFQVRSSKNLLGFEAETNIDAVCTRIKPEGFNGITITGYVDSPLINNYSRIYTRVIKYEDIKVKSENNDEGYDTLAQAQEELIRRAKLEFSENHIDEIQAEYRISFVDLSKTEEYKNYAILERAYIGDTVNVYEEKLDININVRVSKIKYDILRQEVIEMELTNSDISKYKIPSIIDIVRSIEEIPSGDSILSEAKKNATDLINSGLKDSNVIVRKNEIIIGDTKDINTMTKVWRWNNGGLGFSSTGYYGEYGTAITRDGQIVADFITTGLLNASLIKTGLLKSFNGNSWINMENGNFDFAKGRFAFDGTDLQMIGKIINILNGYGIEMNQGGLMFATQGEVVGGIRSSRFPENNAINGFNLVSTRDGDYIDISFTDGVNFEGNPLFYPIIRITKSKHELMGNFKGIQLLDNTRLANTKTFYLASNDSSYPHEIYNNIDGQLSMFGDNGVMLGYMEGNTKVKAIEVYEKANQYKVLINKPLSLQNNPIYGVPNIYTDYGSFRYMNESWCGSIEATAKRISNLNVFYDSGWYAYSNGANGAPSSYGIMLHFKWNTEDFIQIAFDFANTMYQRAWVNGAWTSWKTR